jgi:myosin-1
MLILDQRTLQVKYRVPAADIYRLSLSPFLDNVAVFHIKSVCIINDYLQIIKRKKNLR